jgi:hypothetical protein
MKGGEFLDKTRERISAFQGGLCSAELVKPLKPKLVQIIFNNSVRTAKKTQHFAITKINWLTLFKEIIAVCTENHKNHVSKTQNY